MSNTGTTKINNVDPQKAYDTATFVKNGGIIYCGHEIPENLDFGDVFYCTRCGHFLALVKKLPWITKKQVGKTTIYGENHLATKMYVKVNARVTD